MNSYKEPDLNPPQNNGQEPTPISALEFFRQYGHWLEMVAIIIMYILIGMMKVEDGSVQLNDFSSFTWLDWVLWGITTFLPGIVSLFIFDALRKEGIKQAKRMYPELIQEYYTLIKRGQTSNRRIRGEREFLREKAARKAIKNFTFALIVSFVTGSLLVSVTTDSLVKIGINLGVWAFIGIRSLNESREYGETELKEWYMKEIYRMMVETGGYIDGK